MSLPEKGSDACRSSSGMQHQGLVWSHIPFMTLLMTLS